MVINMTEHRYIFIRDDGLIFGIGEPPTPEDLDHAGVGILTIIRLADQHYFGREGCWRPTPVGKLAQADSKAPSFLPFHVPEHF